MADPQDRLFGAKTDSASKAHAGLVRHYGLAEGTRIFHLMASERTAIGKSYGKAEDPHD